MWMARWWQCASAWRRVTLADPRQLLIIINYTPASITRPTSGSFETRAKICVPISALCTIAAHPLDHKLNVDSATNFLIIIITTRIVCNLRYEFFFYSHAPFCFVHKHAEPAKEKLKQHARPGMRRASGPPGALFAFLRLPKLKPAPPRHFHAPHLQL